MRFISLEHNVLDVLDKVAVQNAADYIQANMPGALALRSRESLWAFAARAAAPAGLWLEFGVFKGYSINYLARCTPQAVYGFDSFRGLQEDWKGRGLPQGSFDLAGKLPSTRSNVALFAGWFNETLPGFLASHPGDIALLHLDCDTYEATAYVLAALRDRITPQTSLILDDYHGFWGYQDGQFKAWSEFAEAHGITYRYAAFNRHAVLIRDIHTPGGARSSASQL